MKLKTYSCLFFFFLIFFSANAEAADNFRYVIQGISGNMLKNVQSRLAVTDHKNKKITFAEIQLNYAQGANEIRQALRPFGYFKANITSRLVQEGEGWSAIFEVDPGEAIKISQLDLQIMGEGKADPQVKQYVENFPLKEGTTFNAITYENAKEGLFRVAKNQGYIKAKLRENKILIDHHQYQAKIVIHFQTGKQYYFGAVKFNTNKYSTSFLNRFIPFKNNQAFSSERLIALQQAMVNSYFFEQVLITPEFDQAENDQVPISIDVVPPKAKKFALGIGYGTLTGPRFTSGIILRHLGKEGHHFNAQMRLSNILSGISAQYFIPGLNPLTDEWLIGANFQKFSPQNGKSRSITVMGGYMRKVDHWQISTNLNFLTDHYSVSNAGNPNERYSKLFYPSINLSYINADNLIDPHFGQSVNFILQGATHYILSSTDFIQARLKTKYLFSPTNFARIILRGELGYTITHNINELPLSMRFFAGGLGSIRGYRDSSIGPGRYLAVGSIEYQQHLVGGLDGALFYDAGNAMNHWNTPYNVGRGVGLIYHSMLGPIRLYLGQAVTKESKPYHFELSIGPEF